MNESGYQEIDLDNPGSANKAADDSDIEIVDETPAAAPAAAAPEPAPTAAREAPEEDDDGPSDAVQSERRKLTRSQRLKAQRDAYAQQLRDAQSRLAAAEARAQQAEADANEGASIGFDLYIKQIDTAMQSLRRDFDTAFESGDRDKIFEVQQQIATLAATKSQAEKDRRTIPTRAAAPQSGQAAPQQTVATQPAKRGPSPAAMEWYTRNREWFNKDAVLTASARVIDQQMVRDGYSPDDPDYFEELDSRLKKEFPHRFGGRTQEAAPAPARQPASNPTIQNRSTPAAAPGKVRVNITQSDRDMAHHLGISIEQYAREKAKTERAQQTATQYTEIL